MDREAQQKRSGDRNDPPGEPGASGHEKDRQLQDTIETLRAAQEEIARQNEELRQERALLRAVIDRIPDYIYAKDAQHRFVTANQAVARLMGAGTAEGLVGQTDADFYPPPLAAEFHAEEAQVLGTGRPLLNKDEPCRQPDGSIRHILTTKVPLCDAEGRVVGLVGVGRDITERKQAEDLLRASEERFQQITACVHDVLYSVDGATAEFRYVSPAFERLLGYTLEDVAARGGRERFLAEVIEGGHFAEQQSHFHALQQPGATQPGRWESWWRAKDGTQKCLEDHFIPVYADGRLVATYGVLRDVTERKRAEEQITRLNQDLQRRLAELQTIFETAPIGLAIADDPEGRHIRGNPANERLLGVGPGGELSKLGPAAAHYRCFHDGRELTPGDLPMQRAIRGETVRGQFVEILREDGQRLVLYASAAPLFDDAEKPAGAVGAFLDVTSLRRAEEAVRESERRMQTALHASRSFTFEWDPASDRVLRSASCGTVLGVAGAEILHDTGQRYFQRVHPEDRGRFVAMLEAMTPAADTYHTEYRVVRGDGTTAVLEESGRGIFDADGKLSRLVGVTTDITERMRAEERTRLLSDVRAQLLAADQPQHIVESLCRKVMEYLDCQAFFNFLVDESAGRLHLNACAGIPAETARQIEWLDFGVAVCGCAAREGCRIVAEDIQTGSDPRTDLVRSFGIQAYACHPLLAEGRVIGTLSFGSRRKPAFHDEEVSLMKAVADHVAIAMQRLRLVESLAEHARAAQAANEAKSQFLANMSHELRTPMNAILGMIDVALPKAVDPTVRDCLATAKGSADLLLTLLDDLLDSAKIESGRLELEAAPFSLRRMLDQVTRVLSVRASEKGLAFHCRVPEGTPDALVGDRMRLQQILLNLAGNAIKFTPKGEVALRVGGKDCKLQIDNCKLKIDEDASPKPQDPSSDNLQFAICNLQFSITDTGIGIPPESLDAVFQPFAQADASTTRRFGGTGLGLSISRRLVEMMGGRIEVQSEVGRGSTFRFTVSLPLATEAPADFEIPTAPATRTGAPLRILLVEDNPANQKLATYILQDRGHRVELAEDGRAAVRLAAASRYDAILMDVQMPGMDGLEATAAIRAAEKGISPISGSPAEAAGGKLDLSPFSRVPIIAMTAHAMRGDRQRCLAAGMDGYLSKPVNPLELIGLVESLAGDGGGGEPTAAAATSPPPPPPPADLACFDADEAIRRCFNNSDMVRQMIGCFFDDLEQVLPRLQAALGRGDLVEFGRLGHRMKGTLLYLGATRAKEAALGVERFCKTTGGTAAEAAAALASLEQECRALGAVLRAHPLK